MQHKVTKAARSVLSRATNPGTVIPSADFDALARELAPSIPLWFRELFTTVPLCGIMLSWQDSEPEGDYDGTATMKRSDVGGIRGESLNAYPGCVIRHSGYVNVSSDLMGGGNPYFINLHEGDDPPLYQVYHDVSNQADEIIAKGRRVVSAKLSDFFRTARVGA